MVLMGKRKTREKGGLFVASPMVIWLAVVPRMVLTTKYRNICGARAWSSRTLPCDSVTRFGLVCLLSDFSVDFWRDGCEDQNLYFGYRVGGVILQRGRSLERTF